MEIKTIKKTITIDAPAQKVWDVLMKDEYNIQWYAYFMPGTKAETDWQVGSKVRFTDDSNSGITGIITANEPAKLLHITYNGLVDKGRDDFDSDMAKAYSGSNEIYTLIERDNKTTLDIAADMGDDYYDEMSAAWEEALKKIKQLSEE
ncbi:SRPBCC domain-containing protein [Mucilaginibacter limnophilus]|uniref:SRPBCC domain-containing protein n=1 Tax=Mucilaginibacter limnophilus TaxID=1932778 RepID=A0A437MUU3_9SPHI|nr:SRPBCC domain-containing protein [Mucilaginibacter limnophilus]RVU01406.1 SRPBCC domain-containing protein [Mucilaginibacter limnophilus]